MKYEMDPRGPLQEILEVIESASQKEGGLTLKVNVKLLCGHIRELNPTFCYKAGMQINCLKCLGE